MDIIAITSDDMDAFGGLMTREVRKLIESGKPITALGIVDGDTAVGALAGYVTGGTFKILSLYMVPEYRRLGGAQHLLTALLLGDEDMLIRRIEASYSTVGDDGKALDAFLKECGFTHEERQSDVYLVSLGELQKSRFFSVERGDMPSIRPFSEIPALFLEKLRMEKTDELDLKNFDADVSVGYIKPDGVTAYALFDKSFEGLLTLAQLYISRNSDNMTLPHLLRCAFFNAIDKYSPETKLAITSTGSDTHKLLQDITGLKELSPVTVTSSIELFPHQERMFDYMYALL